MTLFKKENICDETNEDRLRRIFRESINLTRPTKGFEKETCRTQITMTKEEHEQHSKDKIKFSELIRSILVNEE